MAAAVLKLIYMKNNNPKSKNLICKNAAITKKYSTRATLKMSEFIKVRSITPTASQPPPTKTTTKTSNRDYEHSLSSINIKILTSQLIKTMTYSQVH